ncbi:UPF0473 protein [Dirofilaria immitis]
MVVLKIIILISINCPTLNDSHKSNEQQNIVIDKVEHNKSFNSSGKTKTSPKTSSWRLSMNTNMSENDIANMTFREQTIRSDEFTALPNNNRLKWDMGNTTLSVPDQIESDYNFQQIDSVTIGLVIGISIVVFLIVIVNCFTFRVYLKESKDERSFRSSITESSSGTINR